MICLQYIWKQVIHTTNNCKLDLCATPPLPSDMYLEEYFPLLKTLALPVNTLSVLQVQRYYYNFCS